MKSRRKTTPIQRSAMGETCSVRLPFCCNHRTDTTVYAHIGKKGEATNKRRGDEGMNGVYACSDCHDAIDLRSRYFLSDNPAAQKKLHQFRQQSIVLAKRFTQERLRLKGLLK